MATATVRTAAGFRGNFAAPGDKSVSHRALILAALGERSCRIRNLAPGADVRSTAACLRDLGVEVALAGTDAWVTGVGMGGLRAPPRPLDCGNSGTTMRLLAGVLAGAGVAAVLDGDESLRRRPMGRVLDPLRAMGARCGGRAQPGVRGERAPLVLRGGRRLAGTRHVLLVASAQVKSALLLAGLWAEGETSVSEPAASRDHTERMLAAAGVPVHLLPAGTAGVRGPASGLAFPEDFDVPGDPSSAAFLVGAALLAPGGEARIEGACVNPTRAGFVRVLHRMGADLVLEPRPDRGGEPVAGLVARGGRPLIATDIGPAEVPALIDEIPLLAVVAARARGVTTIRGAEELRVKESDRLARIAQGLRAMGVEVIEHPDGLDVTGPADLRGAAIDAASDHRIAMAFTVAGLAASGVTTIRGAEWADVSFPGFFDLLGAATAGAVSGPT